MAQHEIIGGGAFLDQNIKDINHNFDELFAGAVNTLDAPVTLISSGTVGTYSLLNSGLVIKNAAGTELLRLWASDPDDTNDFNSANLYVGLRAGFSQPSDNVSAGADNTGIGARALYAITTGYDNTAIGADAAGVLESGELNTALGGSALDALIDGDHNTGVGASTGVGAGNKNVVHDSGLTLVGWNATKDSASTLANATALGYQAIVTASNRAVIGNGSVTDVYLGSETPAATLHAKVAQVSIGAFADLPGTPVEGMIAVVNNANTNSWGATISGTGANHVLAYYNGSAWTVMAK